jgi:hypothetical protein
MPTSLHSPNILTEGASLFPSPYIRQDACHEGVKKFSVVGKVWNKLSSCAVNKSEPHLGIIGTECDQVSI